MVEIVASLVLGVVVTVVVGRVLHRAGPPFLDDAIRDERVSDAVARLLAVMFYLVALGAVALLATLQVGPMPLLYGVSIKLGLVMLVIGVVHGGVLAVLLRVRKRRRHQVLEEAMAEQIGVRRAAVARADPETGRTGPPPA